MYLFTTGAPVADSKKVHLYLPSEMGIKLNPSHRRLGSYEGGRGIRWEEKTAEAACQKVRKLNNPSLDHETGLCPWYRHPRMSEKSPMAHFNTEESTLYGEFRCLLDMQ